MNNRILQLFSQFFGERERKRGRLVRHYFFISVLLIGGVLLSSGALEIYFRYRETRENLSLLQHEITAAAAFKIERYIQEIHGMIKAATRSREIAYQGLVPEFKLELEKLLLISPAVTEALALGADGALRAQASRLRAILPEGKKEFDVGLAFKEAKRGRSYFGKVYFVRGSEPYMTFAVPIERFSADVLGILQVEVNLKYIGDVVAAMKVGKAGYAYLVTRSGDLIAHPDISLVLQRRNAASLSQVRAAFTEKPQPAAVIAENFHGVEVFSSYALIPGLDWAVFIERPVKEAYEPLYASMLRTSTLLLVGLGMAMLASLFATRRIVRPLRVLEAGAARIGGGDLEHRLEINTGDELEALADEFNKMTAQLRDSYETLEQKVEDRTKELSESLEQQTATSEILRVISSSPTDVQPVFDTILVDALRICEAHYGAIFRFDGEAFHHATSQNVSPELLAYLNSAPIRPGRESALRRVGLVKETVHIPDVLADPECVLPEAYRKEGIRTALAVPLLRENALIGGITIHRRDVRPFSEKQIALLKTFADQAVIAIENVRLFQELQARTRELARSVDELKALGEVGQAVSSTLDLETVLTTIVTQAVQLSGTHGGVVYEYDDATQQFHLRVAHSIEEEMVKALRAAPIHLGEGAVGQAAANRAPVQVPDTMDERGYSVTRFRPILGRLGYRSLLAVPLLREEEIIGGLVVLRREPGGFSTEVVNFLQTFAAQSVLAIQNAKLFREIEEKSQQLETANRHKSQFLANVSHELRTPLNSIIGFTRLVLRRTEGQIQALQKENLQKVVISSEHLLSLINGLLDLSKIEAGRMEVFAETFKLEDVIRVATATVEPMLKDGRVRLVTEIAPDIPAVKSDREKLKQVILNLLSNAAKFTEKGEIKVSAWREDSMFKLAVSDTGIGMKKEALEYIFEEFRQVDMSTTRKYGGTGLGLAIVKRIINLLGGEVEVESEVGKGSKFTITLPMSVASH